MMKIFVVIPVLALLTLGGCGQQLTKTEMIGIAVGGVLGGYAGAQIGHGIWQQAFIASGAVAGMGAGYVTATKLEQSDMVFYKRTTDQGLASAGDGARLNWSNPETGHSGLFRPVRTYNVANGRLCRSYRATVALTNDIQHGNGTACQNPNGSWQIVSDDFS